MISVLEDIVEWLLEYVFMPLVYLILIGAALAIPVGAYYGIKALWWYHKNPCVSYHTELVHHDAYTTIMPAGKVFIPIYHAPYDAYEDVCDQRTKLP